MSHYAARTVFRDRLLTVILSAPLLALVPAAALIARPPAAVAAPASCGPGSLSGSMEAPSDGSIISETFTMGDDCVLRSTGPQIISPSALPHGQALASVGAATDGPSPLTTINGEAYVAQWTTDCCGITLNEYWLEDAWSSNGSGGYITSYWGEDGYSAHKELPGGGWSANLSDHYLRLTSGGLYDVHETVTGHLGFSYQGVFDPTGTLFYNSYTEYIDGTRSGSWSCFHASAWRNFFPGWNIHYACAAGAYPGA